MKLLIIGGTRFVGRHLTEAALERNWQVTHFNRGQSAPELFPQVEKLVGDRKTDLSALDGGQWDAVIDTCGYLPIHVRASAQKLADKVSHYTFISSISVYESRVNQVLDEDAALAPLENPELEEFDIELYGALKAGCEREVASVFPESHVNLRAGLIVGSHDPTGRFPYWVERIARGGDVLAPSDPDQPIQIIHARDLAEWNLDQIENKTSGAFNVVGPQGRPYPFEQVLDTIVHITNPQARLHWPDETFLLEAALNPWVSLPFWIPRSMAEKEGDLVVSIQRALDHGLRLRSLEDIITDTHEWVRQEGFNASSWKETVTPEKEAQLLQEWRQREAISS